MDKSDPSRTLGFLLHDVSRLLRQSFNRRAHTLGLTQAQWRTLAHLARNEGLNQAALAELLEIQPITLARLIDRLEREGWVERRRPPEDRRAFRLYITEAAQPVLEDIHAIGDRIWERAIDGLDAAQRDELIETLAHIKANMQTDGGLDDGVARTEAADEDTEAHG